MRLYRIIKNIWKNGFWYMFLIYKRKILNLLYVKFVLKNKNLKLDYTSKVEGLNNIEAYGTVQAGRYFWLAAYESYGEQVFQPHIIFKGDFSASEFCHIGATSYIEFGNNVLLGSKVYITDHEHGDYSGNKQSSPYAPPTIRELTSGKQIVIGDNVWIGDNVVILPNVTIGKGTIIGANAVVAKSLPENCIAVGIPAKVIKKYDENKHEWIKVI